MPTPLSTAFLTAAAVFLPISEVVAGILAGLGLSNQAFITVATQIADGQEDSDGLG